jgi:N-acetylglutamate synthase
LEQEGKVRVRVLGLVDYERWMAVWQCAGLTSMRPLGRDSRAAFERQFVAGRQTILGAEADGELIGVVLATHDGRKGWVNRLAVVPGQRRRGVAAILVSEAEKVLRSQGMTVIAALVEPGNEASLRLFRKLGYVEPPHGMHYVSKRTEPQS